VSEDTKMLIAELIKKAVSGGTNAFLGTENVDKIMSSLQNLKGLKPDMKEYIDYVLANYDIEFTSKIKFQKKTKSPKK
jgi:hypothetical protein